jgi:hypothetical protein
MKNNYYGLFVINEISGDFVLHSVGKSEKEAKKNSNLKKLEDGKFNILKISNRLFELIKNYKNNNLKDSLRVININGVYDYYDI